jgi:hypothetical protein
MQKIRFKYSALAAAVIMVVFVSIRLSYPPKYILTYDVFGYYLYLPATFIYDDPGLKDIRWVKEMNEKFEGAPSLYQIAPASDSNYIIRFYAGIAEMYAPFFLAGHLAAHITDYPADGFSKPYQWAIILGGIFYTLAGVWFMRKILISLFSDAVAAVTLLVLFLVSNVFFFCVWGNDAPHVYIFTLYAVIIWLTAKWYENPRAWHAITLGFLIGTAVITRPNELFIMLVPVLWGIWGIRSIHEKLILIWNRKRDILLIIAFIALAVLPQLIYWKYASGHWIYNSYNDPQSGFDFFQPRFGYVLFGFRKGFYIYSPIMILATIGFYHLYKQKRGLFISVLVFFLANLYLISCYSSLISYGWRAFVQVHAVLAIPLACFIDSTLRQKKAIRMAALVFIIIMLASNVFKSWQTMRKIIDGSRMTQEAYFKDFFVVDPKKADKSLLLVDRTEESTETLCEEEKYDHRNLTLLDFETFQGGNKEWYTDQVAHRGVHSYKLGVDNIYSPAVEIPFSQITNSYYAWIRTSVWMFKTGQAEENDPLLVIHFSYNDRLYKYRTISFNDGQFQYKAGEWNKLTIDYLTPEVRSGNDPLKVYVWYRGQGDVFIDDMVVEAFEPR